MQIEQFKEALAAQEEDFVTLKHLQQKLKTNGWEQLKDAESYLYKFIICNYMPRYNER